MTALDSELQSTPSSWSMPARVGVYRPLRVLGRGGMAAVYEAEAPDGELVALKVLMTTGEAAGSDRERFLREARAVGRMHHPHIVPLLDAGSCDEGDYYVMRLIRGRTFDRWLDEDRPELRDSLRHIAAIARALHYAHGCGIVHRDIKASNIIISDMGEPILTDFGIALDAADPTCLTQRSETIGTPDFMSPEQVTGDRRQLGPASDIWSLGILIYYCLVQRLPFGDGQDYISTFRAIAEDDPVHPRRLIPQLPEDACAIALCCLEKRPQRRYPSALDLAEDLDRFVHNARVRARSPSPMRRLVRLGSRHRQLTTVLIAATVLVASLAGVGWWTSAKYSSTWQTVFDVDLTREDLPGQVRWYDWQLDEERSPAVARDADGQAFASGEKAAGRRWLWIPFPDPTTGTRLRVEGDLHGVDEGWEICLNARRERVKQGWFVPSSVFTKVEVRRNLEPMYVLDVAYGSTAPQVVQRIPVAVAQDGRHSIELSLVDQTATLTIDDRWQTSRRVFVPLATGPDAGIAIRAYREKTRLTRLRLERLPQAEAVTPLLAGDTLLQEGLYERARDRYAQIATDHAASEVGRRARYMAAVTGLYLAEHDPSRHADRAFALFDDLLRREPQALNDPALVESRAQAFWGAGRFAEALGDFERLERMGGSTRAIRECLDQARQRDWTIPVRLQERLLRLIPVDEGLHSVDCSSLGLVDLCGLDTDGLKNLDAARNPIASLAHLAGADLNALNLNGMQVADLRELVGTRLRRLSAEDSSLRDLTGVPAEIEALQVGKTSIADLAPLRDCSALMELGIAETLVSDLDDLRALRLRSLGIRATAVADLAVCRDMPLENLDIRDVNHGRAPDLRPLADAPLSILRVAGLRGIDLGCLRQRHFELLDIDRCGLTRLDLLSGWHFKELTCSGNPVGSLEPVASRVSQRLVFDDTQVRDLGPLLDRPPKNIVGRRLQGLDPAQVQALYRHPQVDYVALYTDALPASDWLAIAAEAPKPLRGPPLAAQWWGTARAGGDLRPVPLLRCPQGVVAVVPHYLHRTQVDKWVAERGWRLAQKSPVLLEWLYKHARNTERLWMLSESSVVDQLLLFVLHGGCYPTDRWTLGWPLVVFDQSAAPLWLE